ncbi:hypothetical protein ACMGDM_19600 [Sphingomonas sp. DT-51]|uniref:hypothetical protein n=1 Tax=Sphingomonas sp. DT-51 TaxID=3396165 RepID=UPI003F1A4B56
MSDVDAREVAPLLSTAECKVLAGFPDHEVSSRDLGVRGTVLASLCLWLPRRKGRMGMIALLRRRYKDAEECFLYSITDVGRAVREELTSDPKRCRIARPLGSG